jgi:hypothetical protein
LAEKNVTSGGIDEVLCGLTGVNHETVSELHALGTRSTELSRDNNLTTLSTGLHDESEDTVACTSDSKTVKELVSKRLALCDGGETTVLNLGSVERDGVFREFESLLDERGKLANALEKTVSTSFRRKTRTYSPSLTRPCSPRTSCVWVALMMMSVTVGVTRTLFSVRTTSLPHPKSLVPYSTPLYPSSANLFVISVLSSFRELERPTRVGRTRSRCC